MPDPIAQAKTARETLARALGALQSDATVPQSLSSIAETIASAMGALHKIERGGGLSSAATARDSVRKALGDLQAGPPSHPAVVVATEAVAASLGIVFDLVRQSEAGGAGSAAVAPTSPSMQAAPAGAAAAPADAIPFDVSLGINSPSNFYKGLSGNDVIEHGGIFVATYAKVPKIGSVVKIHVAMPGGYEFDSLGTVAWKREQGTGDSFDTMPGFGAKLTRLAPEARQLIYRYVRNREPLFHDDL